MASVEGLSEGLNIFKFKPVELLAIEAEDGVLGAPAAHRQLESQLTEPFDQTYGLGFTEQEIYFAGAQPELVEDTSRLTKVTLPGGFYAEAYMDNWQDKIDMIGVALRAVEEWVRNARGIDLWVDSRRPNVEVYRHVGQTAANLALRVPVKTVRFDQV
ncbi:MAG TPA: hypothetical protein VFP32_01825 [Candidatus Saccharimonadales bacterium]|nr:hypothetical protein [Candidatus Saccharimonadales bacterium]